MPTLAFYKGDIISLLKVEISLEQFKSMTTLFKGSNWLKRLQRLLSDEIVRKLTLFYLQTLQTNFVWFLVFQITTATENRFVLHHYRLSSRTTVFHKLSIVSLRLVNYKCFLQHRSIYICLCSIGFPQFCKVGTPML